MRYQSELTTVEAVVRQLQKANPAAGTPDMDDYEDFYDYLTDVIGEVSDYIATECSMSFVPYKETKTMYFQDILRQELWDRLNRMLRLPDNAISIASVTWDDTLLAATDYRVHPTDEYSGWGLLMNPTTSLNWNTSDFNAGVEIAATWGYLLNPTDHFRTIASVTVADDTTTSIVVADSTLYEVYGFYRWENEWVQVTSIPDATHIVVTRGVLGTTAVAHSSKALQAFTPVRGIRHVATRMTAYLYQKRLDVGGTVQIGDAAFLLDQLPVTVKAFMNSRRKLSFGHI